MHRKKTTEEFIADAHRIHGNKYDYSNVSYINAKTKVCIICPEHGEFWQTPDGHVSGRGCPICGNDARTAAKKLSKEQFVVKAISVHGFKYDYSVSDYKAWDRKIAILCPTHGIFYQTPNSHLNGCGCPVCGRELTAQSRRKDTLYFIEKAKQTHGDKYDYSLVDYKTSNDPVRIICPIHGEFSQKPYNHLSGKGCPKCAGQERTTDDFITEARKVHGDKYDYSKAVYSTAREKVCIVCPKHGAFWPTADQHLRGVGCPWCNGGARLTLGVFLQKAKEVHGEKYDYSKVEYKNAQTKVSIICSEHGEFWQTPNSHLRGAGCPKCTGRYKTTEEFIAEARETHGDKYDYSKTEYVDATTKVVIICPKHGEFMQTPIGHIRGAGCTKCASSHMEEDIRVFLNQKGIHFIEQQQFSWLEKNGKLKLDFYLPDYKVAIECQGIQHFEPVGYFGGGKGYLDNIERDETKREQCLLNDVRLLYFSNLGIEYPYRVFEDKEELLDAIMHSSN